MYRLLFAVTAFNLAAAPVAAQSFYDASELLPENPPGEFGAAVADVDGDGRPDLIAGGEVLRQVAEGFQRIDWPFAGEGIVADAVGDGRPEMAVLFNASVVRYHPARQTFEPVQDLGALISDPYLTQGSTWLDYDRDGRLDLFVGNDIGPDFLFRQETDGAFENVTGATLPSLDRGTYGAAPADYDRDGDPDIYIGLCSGNTANLLYRNEGGFFIEAGGLAGLADPRPSWGVVWLDYDGDGWLDAYVANMPIGPQPGSNALYRNNGDGTFTDVAEAAGVAGSASDVSWSAVAADFDNDGWPDVFVANSDNQATGESGMSRLYRNNGDGTFTDVTAAAGLEGLIAMPVAGGDINGDGWVDLFVPESFTGTQNDRSLLLNAGGANGYLTVRLRGTASNPDGVGARVEVTAEGQTQVRDITAGDGMMSQSHALTAHFGLGTAASADVTVRWPSGQVDVLPGLAPSQHVTVVEGAGRNEPPEPFALLSPTDGSAFPASAPVPLAWEAAGDEDVVTYEVLLAGPAGDTTFVTVDPALTLPADVLQTEGEYAWAVTATDGPSTRVSLGRARFTSGTGVTIEPAAQPAPIALTVWPNPAREAATVTFTLPAPEAVTLEVFDMLGRRVKASAVGERGPGNHTVQLEMSDLGAGVYVLRLTGSRSGPHLRRLTRLE